MQDALQVRVQHLDAFALTARLLEGLGLGEGTRHVTSLLIDPMRKERGFADYHERCPIAGPVQPRQVRASSGDQFLPQRFSDGLGSVASAELGLRLFQVTSNGLRADIERLGNLRRLRAHRRQSQDGKFPGR